MTSYNAIELRPYQTKAIEQTRAAIANGARRPVLVAPTGSGKTYMAAEIIRLAGEKRSNTFFMCHRRELVFQASDKLNHLGVPHGILMAGETRGEMEPVQVASIQTYWSRYMQPRKDFLPPCELMVIDECVSGDTKIHTNRGEIEISQVDPCIDKFVMSHKRGRLSWQRIEKFYRRGVRRTVVVRTQNGGLLRCTEDHKIETESGWIQAKELKPGDRLVTANVGAGSTSVGIPGEGREGLFWGIKLGAVAGRNGMLFTTHFWSLSRYVPVGVGRRSSHRQRRSILSFTSKAADRLINLRRATERVTLWNWKSWSVRQFLGRCSEIFRSVTPTQGHGDRECTAITQSGNAAGFTTKPKYSGASSPKSHDEKTPGTGRKSWRSRLKAYLVSGASTAWLNHMSARVGGEKPKLAWNGWARLGILVSPGGSVMMVPGVKTDSQFTLRVGHCRRWSLSRVGYLLSLAKSRLSKRGVTSGYRFCKKQDLQSGVGFSPTSHHQWNTNFSVVTEVHQTDPTEVFDITVEGTHKFFANGISVSNCHQAVAQTWRSIIENYPEAVTLGLTATPIRGDKVGLGHIFDHMIQTATISDLTEQGYLVPVRYFAPSMPDLRGVEVRMGDYVEAQLVERMQPLLGDIVENWSRICPDRQTIVFATGVRQSRHIAKRFEEIGVTSAHLDGKSSKSERDEVLKLFEGGEIQVLSNCQLFTHGWDSPPASCCILARPTKALGLYVQMVGRTLRPFEGKQDCIVIDHAGAVYQHGFVDDPMPWMLTCDGKLPSGKFQRRPSASKPICCENCKNVYSRTLACPNCGWEPEPGRELVAFEPAELQQVRRGAPRPHSYSMDDKRKWWAMLEGYRLQRGYKPGWSYYKYREKFHVKPSSAVTSEEPMEPDGQVLGFIRSTQIRWAKSKQQKEGFRDGNQAGKKERAEEGRLWDRGPSETKTNPGWHEGSI